MKIAKKHPIFKWLIISVVIIVGLSALAFALSLNNSAKAPDATSNARVTPVVTAPLEVGLTSKIMFVGDIFWSRGVNTWSGASPLKEAYPFSRLSEFHRDQYDAWVGNMECPADPNVKSTIYQEDTLLQFNCPSTYLPELAKWFNIVSLANNHTDNQGADGFTATKKELDKNNIQYFGGPDPYVVEDACETVSMPVKIKLDDNSAKSGSLPFAMCGYDGVFKIPSEDSLAQIKTYSKYLPTIIYPHMGAEYQTTADQLRTNLYRKMIDYGADAVLGNHPHWTQNSEAYKGKLIVYSMGNFIFDQQDTKEVTRSAVITLDLSSGSSVNTSELSKWLSLGDECKAYADNCLDLASSENLTKLPLVFKFSMSASDDSNKLVKPADASITASVAQRLNWNTTANNLVPVGTPYTNN